MYSEHVHKIYKSCFCRKNHKQGRSSRAMVQFSYSVRRSEPFSQHTFLLRCCLCIWGWVEAVLHHHLHRPPPPLFRSHDGRERVERCKESDAVLARRKPMMEGQLAWHTAFSGPARRGSRGLHAASGALSCHFNYSSTRLFECACMYMGNLALFAGILFILPLPAVAGL